MKLTTAVAFSALGVATGVTLFAWVIPTWSDEYGFLRWLGRSEFAIMVMVYLSLWPCKFLFRALNEVAGGGISTDLNGKTTIKFGIGTRSVFAGMPLLLAGTILFIETLNIFEGESLLVRYSYLAIMWGSVLFFAVLGIWGVRKSTSFDTYSIVVTGFRSMEYPWRNLVVVESVNDINHPRVLKYSDGRELNVGTRLLSNKRFAEILESHR